MNYAECSFVCTKEAMKIVDFNIEIYPTLASYRNRYIFFISLMGNYFYDKEVDNWFRIPILNLLRTKPSACTLADTLYVFGGTNDSTGFYDSIETLVNPSGPTELLSGV